MRASDDWVGCWVAVKDGKVVTAALPRTPRTSLSFACGSLEKRLGVLVAQFVPEPSDDIVIGVG